MTYFVPKAQGHYAGAFYEISSKTGGAVEVDSDHSGDHVGLVDADGNPIVFHLNGGLSLSIDVWCYDEDLDVILQRLQGYTDNEQEVWVDVGSEVALTAAADKDSVSDVAAAMATLISDNVRSGTYRLAAQRAGATDPGYLHFNGVGKA